MKLLLLFTLFCGIFAYTDDNGIPPYNPQNVFVDNCETHTKDSNGIQTKCETCHDGFVLANNGMKCNRITTDIPIPPYVSNGQIIHPEIGYDTNTNTCTKDNKIKIVQSNGQTEITTDKYYGAKSCLACAKYSSNGCEICATGYLANNGGCTPLSINPFGNTGNSMDTNKNCIYGAYEGETPKCYACRDPYLLSGDLCILPSSIEDMNLEGCVNKVFSKGSVDGADVYYYKCTKCQEGYSLVDGVCYKSSFTSQYCMKTDSNGNCLRCIPGYIAKSNQCEKCSIKLPRDLYFTGDECNIFNGQSCECNPNCIRDLDILETCKSRHCDMFSDTEMSTVNKKNPKCLRCEQGYQLDENNECIPCTKEGCLKDENTCVPGYYLSTENGKNVCRKCEGKCLECISKDICIEDKIEVNFVSALNGLPCFDPDCISCSTEDPSICFECVADDNVVLIGGTCYKKSQASMVVNNANHEFRGCRFYKQPDFISDESASVDTTDITLEYVNRIELGYERTTNTAPNSGYYCQHYDNLPHYYRNYEGNKLECAGKNRDIYSDCECLPGYYSIKVDKNSDCIKSNFKDCVKPLSEEICGKCNETMVLINDGVQKYPELRCGCPRTNQRINAEGLCVDCPENCAECETAYKDNGEPYAKCTKCRGETESGDSNMNNNNYNRDLTNECSCLEGYVSHPKGYDVELGADIIYACYKIPEGCQKTENYKISEYDVTCLECDAEGFTVASSCTECEIGYYPVYGNSENEQLVTECKRCPSVVEGNENSGTYCTQCPDGVCTECVAENLDPSKQCRECFDLHSMIYIQESENSIVPHCVACDSFCNLENGNGCFYVTELTEEKESYFENKYKTKIPYTKEEFDSKTHKICEECYDNGDPKNSCSCGNEQYRDNSGHCFQCTEAVGDKEFSTLTSSKTMETHKYNEVCDFTVESFDDFACVANKITGYAECILCKNPERTPQSNCTRCISQNKYAVFENGNHVCKDCKSKCASCNNGDVCASCKEDNVEGEHCDECKTGFYISGGNKEEGVTCTKCPALCSACDSATKCTACASENNLLGPNNNCQECVPGYYYNILENSCIKVNDANGYAESKPVCLNAEGKEIIDCKETETNKIDQVIEIPIKCDTTIGVGISPDPVDRKCVCDKGYFDIRTPEEIEADPIPQCTNIKIVTKDDFCVDGEYDETKKKVVCTKCNNEEYLQLKEGKCICKDTHYTSSWGMCVPCGRHMKGCTKCKGKYYCDECDSSAYKLGDEKEVNGEKRRECVGK